MKLLITGGHLTPALATIEALPRSVEVVYCGRKHALEGDDALSLEYQSITARDIPFRVIHPARIQRHLTRYTIPSLLRLPQSLLEAHRILDEEKPDMILSFGSYVAFPFALIGSLHRIPLFLHEQTMHVGVSSQFLSRFAKTIAISWPTSEPFFPKEKTVLTGNPALSSLPVVRKKSHPKVPLIVVTGGSQGSHAINQIIASILPELVRLGRIVHQTGDAHFNDFGRLSNLRDTLKPDEQSRYEIHKFFDPTEISELYQTADLVITRAGANTIGSLLLTNTPSLVIPIPKTSHNEQTENARFLRTAGLAEIMRQDDAPSTILSQIKRMLRSLDDYTRRKEADSLAQVHVRAAQTLAKLITTAV